MLAKLRITMRGTQYKQKVLTRENDWLAVRVACNICGAYDLNFIGSNEVECAKYHQKNWLILDLSPNSHVESDQKTQLPSTERIGFIGENEVEWARCKEM